MTVSRRNNFTKFLLKMLIIFTVGAMIIVHQNIQNQNHVDFDVGISHNKGSNNQHDELIVKNLRVLMNYLNLKNLTEEEKALIVNQAVHNFLNTNEVEHLLPVPAEKRTISILSTLWRSGSTFVGEILSTVSANYYHYEPFTVYGVNILPGEREYADFLRNLLLCNFTGEKETENIHVRMHWIKNTHFAKLCSWNSTEEFCDSINFRTEYCKIFPRHTVKLTRTHVSLMEHLLNDTRLNISVILQVRDPRAVFASKKEFPECEPFIADFCNLTKHCATILDDYYIGRRLMKEYPHRFRIQRYEEVAMDPFVKSKEMYDFLGLPFEQQVQELLVTHTSKNEGDAYSTFRNSLATVINWLSILSKEEIEHVQEECAEAMKVWGYVNVFGNGVQSFAYPMKDIVFE